MRGGVYKPLACAPPNARSNRAGPERVGLLASHWLAGRASARRLCLRAGRAGAFTSHWLVPHRMPGATAQGRNEQACPATGLKGRRGTPHKPVARPAPDPRRHSATETGKSGKALQPWTPLPSPARGRHHRPSPRADRHQRRLTPFSPRNCRGLRTCPFSQTSRCTWAPVERPVEPALATCCPARTRSPTWTELRELCA